MSAGCSDVVDVVCRFAPIAFFVSDSVSDLKYVHDDPPEN